MPARQLDRAARRLEHFDRRLRDLRVEVVRERVGPEHDAPAPLHERAAAAREPGGERLVREPRRRAFRGDPGEALPERVRGERIRKPRRLRREPCPEHDQAERVRLSRTQPAFVVVREELRLVGRHVDADRTLVLAALAGEAEVERLLDLFRAPAAVEGLAAHHLEEEPRPSARRVLLLPRGLVARAHHAFLVTARPDAEAALRRRGERAAVVVEREVRLHLARLVRRRHAQVRVERVGVGDLAGIHLVVRVPDRLELAERLDELWAEHAVEELGTGLAVAVLARERAAVARDEGGSVLHEGAVTANPVLGGEIPVQPRVQAAVPDVAEVAGDLEVVLLDELVEVAQVLAAAFGGYGGVFPRRPAGMLAGDLGVADAALADLPDLLDLLLVLVELEIEVLLVLLLLERARHALGLRVGLLLGV